MKGHGFRRADRMPRFSFAHHASNIQNCRMLLIKSVTTIDSSPGPAMRFRNYYECTFDRTKWHDQWTCMCNDRCPTCDSEMEPYFSEELEVVD